ncbi:hypothetical protein ACGFX2_36435 [Streptomyces goshikiensis]|uniref:hypothetical protein n=1 Tax=Streptomyces goshikiensis TaxID=1942 RepID=UPI00371867AE
MEADGGHTLLREAVVPYARAERSLCFRPRHDPAEARERLVRRLRAQRPLGIPVGIPVGIPLAVTAGGAR